MKQYQKPEVNYESFILAEHIAQCDYTLNSTSAETCIIKKDNVIDGWDFEGTFLTTNELCSQKINDSYCYTNSSGLLPTHMS